jgi:hypothetical protein
MRKLSIPATFNPDAGVKINACTANGTYPWLTKVEVTEDSTLVKLDLTQAPFGESIMKWYKKSDLINPNSTCEEGI